MNLFPMNRNTFQDIHQNYLNSWISLVKELHSLENKGLLQELLIELSQEYVKTVFGTIEKVQLSQEEIQRRNLVSWEKLKQKLFQDIAKYINHNIKVQTARQLVDALFPENQHPLLPDVQWTIEYVWNVILPPDILDIIWAKSSLDKKERPVGFDKIGLLEKFLSERLKRERTSFNWKKGILQDNQMRKVSYYYLYLPEFDKTILLNNQYWESSFILDWSFDVNYFFVRTKTDIKDVQWIIAIPFDYKNPQNWLVKMRYYLFSHFWEKNIDWDRFDKNNCNDNTNEIISNTNKNQRAPDWWFNHYELTSLLWLNPATEVIKNIIEKYRNFQPLWFAEYLNKANRLSEYYSPELFKIIKKELEGRWKNVPKWWKTITTLNKELHFNSVGLKKISDQYRSSHPEWFKKYVNKSNQINEFCSPELCKIIKEEIENRWENAPEGRKTNYSLSIELNYDNKLLKKLSNQYRGSHPEWFREYLNEVNKSLEYYSPDLCEIIKTKLNSRWEKAPNGWYTLYWLAENLNCGYVFIKNIAEKYREDNPQWFKNYLDEVNKPSQHYSPDLCKKIKEEVQIYLEKAPKGRYTISWLAKELSVDSRVIRDRIEKHRFSHPEWFSEYLNKSNRPSEYYSPELCKLIIEEVSKKI